MILAAAEGFIINDLFEIHVNNGHRLLRFMSIRIISVPVEFRTDGPRHKITSLNTTERSTLIVLRFRGH